MASTNKTTNYELSQFVASDKPTFLGDYNGDMQKIDTAIAGVGATASGASSTAASALTEAQSASSTAASAATTAATADTNATSALTTAGNAATAASAAQSTADSAASAASAADGKATAAQTAANAVDGKVGDLANLTTTEKTSVVGAINEVNAKSVNVGIELTETVASGATSVTFTNAAITSGAKLLLFFDDVFIPYSAVTVGTGTVTYTIEETTASVTATLWVI